MAFPSPPDFVVTTAPVNPPKGLGLSVYGGNAAKSLPLALPVLNQIRPSFVALHTWPDDSDAALVTTLKNEGHTRVWFVCGSNSLANMDEAHNKTHGRDWITRAHQMGAEALILDIEAPEHKGLPGWVLGADNAHNAELELRLKALLAGIAEGNTNSLVVGITSHDMLRNFVLPPSAYLDPVVRCVFPQVYPSVSTKTLMKRTGVNKRLLRAVDQWHSAKNVRDDLRPGQPGWGMDIQLWGQTGYAAGWLADQADCINGWELPLIPRGSSQLETLQGIHVAMESRRRFGDSANAVGRAQVALRLHVDQIPGPELAAALGLPWV